MFVQLSKDDIWGVRKSCAESLAEMSTVVPEAARYEEMVNCFIRLQEDVSRWVRFAALRSLGPLIATITPGMQLLSVPGALFFLNRFADSKIDSHR